MKRPVVRVRDVMRSDFIMVDGLATIADVLALLAKDEADAVIVDKRDDDDEYGMVRLSTVVKHVLSANRSPERINAYELMHKPAVTVQSDMDIRYCARLFSNLRIYIAPVIENDEIVGIITYRELAFGGAAGLANAVNAGDQEAS